ncbi:hypothetical protein P5673_015691 [Acropora cervicornis]|uniref:Uncharacterized protein n=1 Tax=Acropora cervicornis TaxID=6130 RepID=A0AAD9QHB5_ACRCE|nr:hypothetical protein P5673_015691 [Acropora cervicornis]
MERDFRVCLVKASLLWSLAFLVLKGASSADAQKCEISCRLGDGPKDEETVDPDSIIPSHCSIKNGRNISRNTTWKEVNDKLTLKPGLQCLVLKSGNSVKRIFFARKLLVAKQCLNTLESPAVAEEPAKSQAKSRNTVRPICFVAFYVLKVSAVRGQPSWALNSLLWKAITFLCGHSLLHDVVSPLCDVLSSICDVVLSLCDVVSPLRGVVSPLRDVVLPLCDVVSPLRDVVLPLCDVVSSLRDVVLPLCDVVSPLRDVVLSLCDVVSP